MVTATIRKLGHCLTCYVTGDADAITPRSVPQHTSYADAGLALETELMEGTVVAWPKEDNPKQPGVPFSFLNPNRATEARSEGYWTTCAEFMDGTSGMDQGTYSASK